MTTPETISTNKGGQRKRITVVTPCYNEEANVRPLCEALIAVFTQLPQYEFDHLYIDNRSLDNTPAILRELASQHPHVKVIFNARNFGHIRSPAYGLLQAHGDAAILMASDFQDPPAMVIDFVRKWEEGYKIVIGVKTESEESAVMYAIRTFYYGLARRLADVELLSHVTGFGIYDRQFLEIFRKIDDPYPYLRGLISEIGLDVAKLPYKQPTRKRGISKNNFYTLYDMAMLGFTNHSKVPLRIATLAGMLLSLMSLLLAFGFFVAKLVFWNYFTLGIAPLLIGLFFFSSVQLFFIGILGEYIGAIHTRNSRRPLVVERERLNFEAFGVDVMVPTGRVAPRTGPEHTPPA